MRHHRGRLPAPGTRTCRPEHGIVTMLGVTIAIVAVAISISALGIQIYSLRRAVEDWTNRPAA